MQTPNTLPSFRCPRDCGTAAAAATTAAVQSVKDRDRAGRCGGGRGGGRGGGDGGGGGGGWGGLAVAERRRGGRATAGIVAVSN